MAEDEMTEIDQKAYSQGRRDARKGIATGFPRWIQIGEEPFTGEIHAGTGLPIMRLSGSDDPAVWRQPYAKGSNDEMLVGIESGKVKVDFRPLLMTRDEVQSAMETSCLGTLSLDNPKIQSPRGDFVLEVVPPKRKSKSKHIWISYNHESGERRPDFDLYDGPLRVATGRDGRVLVFENEFGFHTRDVVTTQVLNSYQRCKLGRWLEKDGWIQENEFSN